MKTRMLRSRTFWLVATATLMSGGTIGACSSSSDNGFATDAGSDGTFGDGSSDGSRDGSGGGDGSSGGDSGPTSCPSLTLPGTCDLVTQNCEAGNECDPVFDNSGNIVAACIPQSSGSVPLGHECCPDQNNGNCVSGTSCGGPPCTITDGGPGTKTGRCAPYCCPTDSNHCGESDPEGVRGVCNTTTFGSNPDGGSDIQFGMTCTYPLACKPFGVQPCGSSAECTLADDGVSFRCNGIENPPGQDAGTICNAGNACKSGMECLGPVDASTTCTLMCYQKDGGTPPPFDAAALPMTPGFGGCYPGQTCAGTLIGGPAWYGFCAP